MKIAALILGALVTVYLVASLLGSWRWSNLTRELRERLDRSDAASPQTVNLSVIAEYPEPVKRYLNRVLTPGSRIPTSVRITHEGTFNQSEQAQQWVPFTSDQRVALRRPGFDWNATMRMMPGVGVRVHDAYHDGRGYLHAAVLGLVSVARVEGGGTFAASELMRFLAESPWYPAVLLPGNGIHWDPIDDRSATATLQDADLTVALVFEFRDDGLLERVRADARGRSVGDEMIPTPWEGRFGEYEMQDETLIPLEGEVAWVLPEGTRPYWRGRITSIAYE